MSSYRNLTTGEAEQALLSKKSLPRAKYRLPCIPPGNQTVQAATGHLVLTFGQINWDLKPQVVKSGFAPPDQYQYRVVFPGERTKGHVVPLPTDRPEELAIQVKANEQELKAYLRDMGHFKIGCEDCGRTPAREFCVVNIDMMKTIGLRQQVITCSVSAKGMIVGKVNVGFKMVWNSDLEKGVRTMQGRRRQSSSASNTSLRPLRSALVGAMLGTESPLQGDTPSSLQTTPVTGSHATFARNPRTSGPSKLPRGPGSSRHPSIGSEASLGLSTTTGGGGIGGSRGASMDVGGLLGTDSPQYDGRMASRETQLFKRAGLSNIPSPPGRHTEGRIHSRHTRQCQSLKEAAMGNHLPETSPQSSPLALRPTAPSSSRSMKGVLSWDHPSSVKGPELSAADLSPNSGINIGALFVSITEALEAQKIRLLELFRRYDRDKSTSLNWSELGFLLVDLLPYPPTRMQHGYFMSMLDADGDGEVSYRDFAAVIRECKAAGMQVRAGEMTERRRMLARVALRILERQLDIARAWRKFADKNNIQILDFERLVRMLRYLLPDLTDKEDRKLMSCLYMLDRHNAGHISYQEFKYFLLKGAKRFLKSNKRQKWDDTMFILPSNLAGMAPLDGEDEEDGEEEQVSARAKEKEKAAELHMLQLKDEDLLRDFSGDLHAPKPESTSPRTEAATTGLQDVAAVLPAGTHERTLVVPKLPPGTDAAGVERAFDRIAGAAARDVMKGKEAVEKVTLVDDPVHLARLAVHARGMEVATPPEEAAYVTFKDAEVCGRVSALSGAILVGNANVDVARVAPGPPPKDSFPAKFGGDIFTAIWHAHSTGMNIKAAFDSLDTEGTGRLKPAQLRELLHLIFPEPTHAITQAHEDYFVAVMDAEKGRTFDEIIAMAEGFKTMQLAITRPGGFIAQDTEADSSPLQADWMEELDDVDTYDLVHAEQKALERALTGMSLKLAAQRKALEDMFQKQVAIQHRLGGPKRGARVMVPHATVVGGVMAAMGDALSCKEVPLLASLMRHVSNHPDGLTFPEFKQALDIAVPKPENIFPDKFGGDSVVAIAHAVDKDGLDVEALFKKLDTEGKGELDAAQLRKLLHAVLPAPHKVLAAHEDYFLTMLNVASDKPGAINAITAKKTISYADMMASARACCAARIAVSRPDGILTMDADVEGDGPEAHESGGEARAARDATWIADYEDDEETYDDMMEEQEALGKVLMKIAMKVADHRAPLEDAFKDAAKAAASAKSDGTPTARKGSVPFADAIRIVRNVLGDKLTTEEEQHMAALLRYAADDKKGMNMKEFQRAFKMALSAAANYNAVFSEQTDREIEGQAHMRSLFDDLWPQLMRKCDIESVADPEKAVHASMGWPLCLVFKSQIKDAVGRERTRRLETSELLTSSDAPHAHPGQPSVSTVREEEPTSGANGTHAGGALSEDHGALVEGTPFATPESQRQAQDGGLELPGL